MSQELILAAKNVMKGLLKMKEILPVCDDGSLLLVARALYDEAPKEGVPKGTLEVGGPRTMTQALTLILKEFGGTGHTKDVFKVLVDKGWSYLSDDKMLYSKVCRTLSEDLAFARIHRGFYRLADVQLPPQEPKPPKAKKVKVPSLADSEDPIMDLLLQMEEPVLARDLLPRLRVATGNKSLGKYWLQCKLRILHRDGKVRVAKQLHNKTAFWEAVK